MYVNYFHDLVFHYLNKVVFIYNETGSMFTVTCIHTNNHILLKFVLYKFIRYIKILFSKYVNTNEWLLNIEYLLLKKSLSHLIFLQIMDNWIFQFLGPYVDCPLFYSTCLYEITVCYIIHLKLKCYPYKQINKQGVK